MKCIKKIAEKIALHALEVIEKIDENEISKIIDILKKSLNSYRVFIVGSGRSELVGKMFAMRLMHLGFTVYVVGDVTTPAIKENDCLIAISGTGETKIVTLSAETAKEVSAKVIGITGNLESTLSKSLDVKINIKTKTKKSRKNHSFNVLKGNYDDLTPMGTLFEDTAHLFLDGLIAEFMTRLGKKEIDLKKRHFQIKK